MCDQRVVQVSRCVEDVIQASYALLEAREQEDGQSSRSAQTAAQAHTQESEVKQLLLCHRQANGACERFLMDLQHAQVLVGYLKAQGGGSLTVHPEEDLKTQSGAGLLLPTQYVEGMHAYDEAVQQCLWSKKK
mmetsp:Transcript_38002/g.74263  ORF Transcript_38002/g.74263 Transcript_38002/m.74263 type:complete len:133 (-) Transcript_38002:1608-2006(-)